VKRKGKLYLYAVFMWPWMKVKLFFFKWVMSTFTQSQVWIYMVLEKNIIWPKSEKRGAGSEAWSCWLQWCSL